MSNMSMLLLHAGKAADSSAPGPPTAVTALAASPTTIQVAWTDPADTITSRDLEYAYSPTGTPVTYTLVPNISASPYTLTVTAPSPGSDNNFVSVRVRANSAAGNGAWSAPVTTPPNTAKLWTWLNIGWTTKSTGGATTAAGQSIGTVAAEYNAPASCGPVGVLYPVQQTVGATFDPAGPQQLALSGMPVLDSTVGFSVYMVQVLTSGGNTVPLGNSTGSAYLIPIQGPGWCNFGTDSGNASSFGGNTLPTGLSLAIFRTDDAGMGNSNIYARCTGSPTEENSLTNAFTLTFDALGYSSQVQASDATQAQVLVIVTPNYAPGTAQDTQILDWITANTGATLTPSFNFSDLPNLLLGLDWAAMRAANKLWVGQSYSGTNAVNNGDIIGSFQDTFTGAKAADPNTPTAVLTDLGGGKWGVAFTAGLTGFTFVSLSVTGDSTISYISTITSSTGVGRVINSQSQNALLHWARTGITSYCAGVIGSNPSAEPGPNTHTIQKAAAGNWSEWIGGVSQTVAAITTDWGGVGLALSGIVGEGFGGVLGSVVVCNANLSSGNRALMEAKMVALY